MHKMRFTCMLLQSLFLLPLSVWAGIDILSKHPSGLVFTINGNQPQYLAGAQSLSAIQLPPTIPVGTVALAASFWMNNDKITKESFEKQLNFYRRFDDVWTDNFIDYIVISYKGDKMATVEPSVYDWLKLKGASHVFLSRNVLRTSTESIPISVISTLPPAGPLLVSTAENDSSLFAFHNVYRLYLDVYDAFILGAIPDLVNGGWIETNLKHIFEDGSYSQLIPVPSRIPMISSTLPIAGMRFGLKDIYNAKGLATAAGSHAYRLTHEIPKQTAPSVQKLVDLGAVMVGKTRTSQFAHGAQPWEFIDVPYSWNPRGDGHLTAAASSSGSACAIAAYHWLEFTVGSDTRGSVRKPATLVGVYGIRPSHGSMDLTGVVPLSEEMDTAGFFTRHPGVFHEVASRWFSESPVSSKKPVTRFPSKLLYPIDHFPVKNEQAQRIINRFIEILQLHLDITPVPVDFTEIITPFLPNGSFPAFQLSSNKLAEYRSWVDVGKPTTDKFKEQFSSPPVFDPVPRMMFSRAQHITEDDFKASVKLKRAFHDALALNIFKENPDSCSDSIFIYEAAMGGRPSYRVEEFNHLSGAAPFVITAAAAGEEAKLADFFNFIASMGELPEVTIPIGEARYYSQITRTWEPIPVAIELVARKGCDGMLLDLVKRLGELGAVRTVDVGRYMFPQG